MPHFCLADISGAPSRVAETCIGPSLDGSVLEFERDPKNGLVEQRSLLKVPLVVVSRPEIAVSASLFDPVAEGCGQLEVLHVAVHGPVKVTHGQVDCADIAYLACLLLII